MTEPFNRPGNPSNDGRKPFGGWLGSRLKPYRAGARIDTPQAAPSTELECVSWGNLSRAQVLVRIPTGCGSVTLGVGRWTQFPAWGWSGGGAPATAAFVHVETFTFTGDEGSVHVAEIETLGDPIGAWVSAIGGTMDPADSVQMWMRAAG